MSPFGVLISCWVHALLHLYAVKSNFCLKGSSEAKGIQGSASFTCCLQKCHTPCLQEYQECAGGIICTCCESCSYAWLAEQSLFPWNQFPIALWTVHALLVFTWRKMDQCLCDSAGRQSSSRSWEKVHSRVLPMSLWSVTLHLETASNNPILPASTWGYSGNCWGCFVFLFCLLRLHF